ncbi:MAG: hypothetical protein ABIG42_08490 [bacterium]
MFIEKIKLEARRGLSPFLRKPSYIKPFLILATLAVATTIYAVQSREIESRLNAGDVKITRDGLFDIIQLDGPVDFNHKGHSFKGNSATLKLNSDGTSVERTPVELKVLGNVKYDDTSGYSATCKSALFNFALETADLSGTVFLRGNNITLNAAQVTYAKKDEKLTAKGSVHFESQTKYIPLSPDSGNNDELVTYNLDCESLIHNNKLRTISALSNIEFKIGETGILCQKADIILADNEITSVICEGNVKFYDPYMTGSADIVKYDKSSLTLVLLSNSVKNVLVSYKGQDVKGKRVTVTLGDEREIILDKGTISVKAAE